MGQGSRGTYRQIGALGAYGEAPAGEFEPVTPRSDPERCVDANIMGMCFQICPACGPSRNFLPLLSSFSLNLRLHFVENELPSQKPTTRLNIRARWDF